MAKRCVLSVASKITFLALTLCIKRFNGSDAMALQQGLQVQRMTSHEYRSQRQQPDGPVALDRPILITDAVTELECEALCEQWLEAVGMERITIQRKRTQPNQLQPELYEVASTVARSVNLIMNSKVNDSMFAFLEGYLDSKKVFRDETDTDTDTQQKVQALDSVQRRLVEVREALFATDDDTNWFDYFPDHVKPSDCVIMAGEGATSTLHRDPFEWTGTSLCLEGRKIWRFLDGNDHYKDWDDRLKSYRLNSTAWEDDNNNSNNNNNRYEASSSAMNRMTLSAGRQSNLSLYQHAKKQQQPFLSARQLSELDELSSEAYLEELAATFNKLKPHNDIQPAPIMGVDCCSVVQHPGQLLLIPPYWYHQTYGAEPSIAVASQRCGSRLDAVRVLRHILSLQPESSASGLPQSLQEILDGTVNPVDVHVEETVNKLFEHLQQSWHR